MHRKFRGYEKCFENGYSKRRKAKEVVKFVPTKSKQGDIKKILASSVKSNYTEVVIDYKERPGTQTVKFLQTFMRNQQIRKT